MAKKGRLKKRILFLGVLTGDESEGGPPNAGPHSEREKKLQVSGGTRRAATSDSSISYRYFLYSWAERSHCRMVRVPPSIFITSLPLH
ncbi:hypothetical protein TNIN_494241 [Trichonephila inaurata madagascariensis]|uniref:Uncharacterized protein n=1 Tax=Trichonephila inaurata madagascariensis TaxID=2747483 RepID=A0A8X7CLP0_9ARAC|nr:hypothetical protein TNIN_494241 [Trichonephila inaurata madagascariensis]